MRTLLRTALLLAISAVAHVNMHAQAYGSLWMELSDDGASYEAYSYFDATVFPQQVIVCRPNCTTYYTTASMSVTITTPSHRSATSTQGGLIVLQPETVLPIGGETTNLLVSATATYNCGGQSGGGFFSNYFEYVHTRAKWLGTKHDCSTNAVGHETCLYDLQTWCDVAHTPPDFDPSPIDDGLPNQYYDPTFVDASGFCIRVLQSQPWGPCHGLSGLVNHIPSYPRDACTKNN